MIFLPLINKANKKEMIPQNIIAFYLSFLPQSLFFCEHLKTWYCVLGQGFFLGFLSRPYNLNLLVTQGAFYSFPYAAEN